MERGWDRVASDIGGVSKQGIEKNGVLKLLQEDDLTPEIREEMEIFDNLPEAENCYFKHTFLEHVAAASFEYLSNHGITCKASVELGSGQGHFASVLKKRIPTDDVYAVDLSFGALSRAKPDVHAIQADVRKTIFLPESLGLAAFWVSLHHLPIEDILESLAAVSKSLVPGGLFIALEPNAAFLPRRVFMKSPLAKLVYFEKESPFDADHLRVLAEKVGLERVGCVGINPPYSTRFLRQFRLWPMFKIAVDTLNWTDRVAGQGDQLINAAFSPMAGTHRLNMGSYSLSVFKKAEGQR